MCITDSRCGKCFWDGWPCASKCEKDGKAKEFQEVSDEDMVGSRDGHSEAKGRSST